jgi:chemotaxis protein methyltransferase CheR
MTIAPLPHPSTSRQALDDASSGHRVAKVIPSLGYGDYLRFSKLVQNRCGLYFPDKRRAELELGVRQAFAASTCADLDKYYRLLQDPDGAVEMDRLINALTISETHFFRDAGQFDALCSHVLPQIIKRRSTVRTMRIWSAGCASGEEPYSIAMMLRELLPDVDEWSITILGTDVNTEALNRARKGVYNDWAFREERAKQWRPRYFRPYGKRYELISEVQHMVTFARHNLAEDDYPSFETNTMFMDLILCRNVTIYFTESFIQRIVERFYDALVDGGWMAVGHSETSLTTYRRFQARNFPDAILYQRTGQPTALPPDWDWLYVPSAGKGQTSEVFGDLRGRDGPVPAAVPAPLDVQPTPPVEAGQCTHPPKDGDPLERAQELLDYGHSEKARDVLLELIGLEPEHPATPRQPFDPSTGLRTGFAQDKTRDDAVSGHCARICVLLGRAYANLSCWPEAEDWCRQAVRFDKLALEAYYTLALVLQHQGQLDQAIKAMKKVIYIDRNYVLGHFGLANLYRANGQMPQAQKSLDNARRLLETHAADEVIPDSSGITAGRLREATIRQQQQWIAEANGL